MNILVDGRTWSAYAAGVSSFLKGALLEWAAQRPEDRFHILLPKGLDERLELPALSDNIILHDYARCFPRRLPNLIILQLLVPYLCRRLHIHLYYAPVPHLPFMIPASTKTMVTVHDVVNLEMAHTMSWTNRIATSIFFGKAICMADLLWTNSRYTKSKVEHYFPQRRCKDIFTGCATDRRIFFPKAVSDAERQAVRRKYGITNQFILFVGSQEPRKNLRFLLSLMPRLYQEHGVQLVVVGGNSWKNDDVREILHSQRFPKESTIFCGYLSNEELARLYRSAACFVSTAFMEGFGMPQLEAMLCGCPVVTAHNTAMIEVAEGKEGAVTVEGYDPHRWEAAILDMMSHRRTVNPTQLESYDWARIVEDLNHYISGYSI